ncbi:hypothetical protein LTR64_000777 [Lithohypha guttulata]|uniref:uncharacterized protein n=1 Tax=Lithohypha guttulata TaxID=1690604 RepID=UPI002DDF2F7F|nr:hypothetical protein LTR51_005457 [Lithohypha guttulata]
MAHPRDDDRVDVVIVGSGSAGCATALWLAIYNDRFCKSAQNGTTKGHTTLSTTEISRTPITYRILEPRQGRLELGQADGVQCRTVEIYESFGLGHLLRHEGYWVNEVVFWASDDKAAVNGSGHRGIVRTGRTADVAPGLSHEPHIILNQARINGLMLDRIQELKGRDVDYNWKVIGIEAEEDTDADYPVKVLAEHQGQQKVVRAKYVLGADGAHSTVRRSLGIPMEGDSTDAVWGVMDIFPRTTFPDVRKKSTIRSDAGTLMIIPREGDSMIRLYIEMPAGTSPKAVTLEQLQNKAREMFRPYDIEFLATAWWSAYSIGQRVARSMVDPSGRIFLSGDASHTHSPKAGQGMNASLQDGYNLGWKLGALLTGQADGKILQSYIQERHKYAKQLIDFDRYFAKLFSSKPRPDGTRPPAEEFNQAFIKSGVFTAGMAANYGGSDLVDVSISNQELAKNIVVGERLPSAQVVRLSDSKTFHFQSLAKSDGRWRLMMFAGNVDDTETFSKLSRLGEILATSKGPSRAITPHDLPIDSILEYLVVLEGDRSKVEFDQIHSTFKPTMQHLPIQNLHKIFCDDESWNWGHGHAYQTFGIDPKLGCMVLVRPDQYVSAVLSLHEDEVPKISAFFTSFMRPATT